MSSSRLLLGDPCPLDPAHTPPWTHTERLIMNLRCRQKDNFWSIGAIQGAGGGDVPTYVLKFCPVQGYTDVLALANEEGCIALQDTKEPRKAAPDTAMSGFQGHSNAIYDLAWAPTKADIMASVSGDQSIKVWDLRQDFELVKQFNSHLKTVKVVDFSPESNDLLATGSRDNTLRLWDLRAPGGKDCVNVIKRAHSNGQANNKKRDESSCTITALKFLDEHTLVSTSDQDGLLKVWDLRKSYDLFTGAPKPKFLLSHPFDSGRTGFNSMTLDSSRRFAYVGCMDDNVYEFDLVKMDKKPRRRFTGCSTDSFFSRVSLSHDDSVLATGSSRAEEICLWSTNHLVNSYSNESAEDKIKSVKPLAFLRDAHTSPVTCVSWSKSHLRLASCDDDLRHKIWDVAPAKVDKPDCGTATMVSDLELNYKFSLVNNRYIPTVGAYETFVERDKKDSNENAHSPVLKRPRLDRSPLKPSFVSNLPCSPRKMNVTPQKAQPSPRKLAFSTPTANLPNFVRDGITPRTKVATTPKPKTPNNWLSELSRRKKENLPKSETKTPRVTKTPASGRKRKKKSL